MKSGAISTKIRIIGVFFIMLMISIILTTVYLNEKNRKDARVIDIVAKERMLSQQISKNIFYIYHNTNHSFTELNNASEEFIFNLNSLKNGNKQIGILKAPTKHIEEQLRKVELLWNDFNFNITKFKEQILIKNNQNDELKDIVNTIYNTNNTLLQEVEALVLLYVKYTEEKTTNLRYIEYFFGLSIILLMFYSFIQLKAIENNAKKFFEFSQNLVQASDDTQLEPIKIEAEKEIVAASNTINCFIDKINSAMNYSASAIEQSENASIKLEEITDEFDKVIHELTHSSDILMQLNKSEDMVIQSQDDLINSTRKLQLLKDQLDNLLTFCKPQK
ncbi:type IV pili methyl-accepting chemotaxis transducer N-terminal domain-containing protein [Poseidonibacter sp.]|uniref:type IV pili methyl-accepting chemotaxis transducer N-terminal domain-containing protein n=1 Tax=Poseidonibacter sp. TaxID=2321188 RepID=UPI003C765935